MHQYVTEFENQYLLLRQKFKQQKKQIRKLNFIQHVYSESVNIWLLRIMTKKLWICNKVINFDGRSMLNNLYDSFTIDEDCLEVLTLQSDITLKNEKFLLLQNKNHGRGIKYNIKTLQLVDQRLENVNNIFEKICTNQLLIESLNLHNSLVNLIIADMYLPQKSQTRSILILSKILNAIIQKKYYCHLQRVHLLFFYTISDNDNLDWFFNILKENIHVFQDSFTEFNVCFRVDQLYHVLELHLKSDQAFLDEMQQKIYKDSGHQSENERKMNRKKYDLWNAV